MEARSSTQASLPPSSKDFSSKLYCPHDFSHQDEIRDDLPTLLKRNTSGRLQLPDEKQLPTQDKLIAKPSMALFEKSDGPTQEEELRWAHMRKESQALRMPYKRYLAILPLMEQLKQDQIAREHSEQLKRRLCPTASAPEENIKLQAPATKAEVEIYSLPLKEQLKRKHQSNMDGEQPSTSKKARKDENTQPIVKKEINEQNESIEVVEPTEESDEDDVLEVPIERQPADQAKPPQNQGKRQKRKQLQQRFKAKNRANHPQGSNLQVPQPKPAGNFDYKNVDFRQFKGGAQRARGTEIKQQMHGKVRLLLNKGLRLISIFK